MSEMKTPGVYVVEKSAFPNSVVAVETAIPAFIGYTETASNNGVSILNEPWPISSMSDFITYFGGPPKPIFKFVTKKIATDEANSENENLATSTNNMLIGNKTFNINGTAKPPVPTTYQLQQSTGQYLLYYSMQLFFQNGGGNCFIVSVGNYSAGIKDTDLMGALTPLLKHEEPTMVVMPDAVLLSAADCISVQQQVLMHCGYDMQNRVAILDVWNGFLGLEGTPTCIDSFRDAIGTNHLDYAMSYYPWLNTTIVGTSSLSYENLDTESLGVLASMLNEEFPPPADSKKSLPAILTGTIAAVTVANTKFTPTTVNATLNNISQVYKSIIAEMATLLNILPPSAAMAGVYTAIDNTQGVWKAPANVSLNSVVSPMVKISAAQQQDLNVPICGKAVNAIRAFKGEGVMVWGARTLNGNSQDWRYVNVRRTMIMIEQSVKDACQAYVFAANDAHTWLGIETMISSFLSSIWSQGGLAGPSAAESFSVAVGLGKTMTANDILNGILNVTVLVAITHPAEFIQITFEQEMQK